MHIFKLEFPRISLRKCGISENLLRNPVLEFKALDYQMFLKL
ncbi:3478_t:CDS:2 [Rhizophagus irregularis]|nr:3478_t:CDS:2 [Rhizophagus irregularis]